MPSAGSWLRDGAPPGLSALRLDEQGSDIEVRILYRGFDPADALFYLRGAQFILEFGAQRRDHLARAHLHSEHAVDAEDAGIFAGNAQDRFAYVRMRCFAH